MTTTPLPYTYIPFTVLTAEQLMVNFLALANASIDYSRLPASAQDISLGSFRPSKPNAGELLWQHQAALAMTIPSNFQGSYALANTASSGTAVFNITKNSSVVATVTFNSSVNGVFSTQNSVSISAGDILRINAPVTQDSNLSDVSFSILALRN